MFLSTGYIEHRIESGVNANRKGYSEIYSRIGRKFYELEPTAEIDVAAVCHANGLTGQREIRSVISESRASAFDLRCVRRAVHREKKIAEAREAGQSQDGGERLSNTD